MPRMDADAVMDILETTVARLEELTRGVSHKFLQTVTDHGVVYEYSTLYYGDWMARHERSHLNHMARIVAETA